MTADIDTIRGEPSDQELVQGLVKVFYDCLDRLSFHLYVGVDGEETSIITSPAQLERGVLLAAALQQFVAAFRHGSSEMLFTGERRGRGSLGLDDLERDLQVALARATVSATADT